MLALRLQYMHVPLTIVHACTLIIVHAWTMIIAHVCTMSIVHACITTTSHILCPSELMFNEIKSGGGRGAKPPIEAGQVLGALNHSLILENKSVYPGLSTNLKRRPWELGQIIVSFNTVFVLRLDETE